MNNRSNKNISFYYYGQDHFILNVYKFIKSQIEKNNYVFLHCDDNLYNMLIRNLDSNEKNMVGRISLDKIIMNPFFSMTNYKGEDNPLKEIKEFIYEGGFWGGNLIIDASCLIDSVGASSFLECIGNLSFICKENNFNALTCYDFSDYINRNKRINEDIIKASYSFHQFRFYANKVISSDNFNIDENLA